jgi:hypothetical protein
MKKSKQIWKYNNNKAKKTTTFSTSLFSTTAYDDESDNLTDNFKR